VRKTHCQGRKHKDNVKFYYQKWMEEQAQNLIDATTAAYKAGKIGMKGVCIPPPNMGPSAQQMAMPPGSMAMQPGQMPMGAPPMMSMPPMMRPPMGQMPMGAPPMMPPMPPNMRPPMMVNPPPNAQGQ